MDPRYDETLMVKCAEMYYLEGYTQSVIAKQFGLSRSSVCMILSDARDYGIVEINIKNPKRYNEGLAKDLMEKFPCLQKCFVVPTSITSIDILTKIIASQGASVAENELASHSTLGVAWGTTVYEFMQSFKNESNLNDIEVIPLIGGTNHVSSEFQLNEMVRKLAKKLQGTPTFIYAPAYAESIEDKNLYMKSQSMQNLAEKWTHMDSAIVSVGSLPEYYNNKVLFDPFVIKTVFEQDVNRAVGDICGRRFNFMGQFLSDDHNRKLIAIKKEDLLAINKVICIAAGNHKVLSIIGGLRTDTINTLITDENTANMVLDISNI